MSALFSFIARAMALPPSSYSRLAAKLGAEDRHESHVVWDISSDTTQQRGALLAPWDLLQPPEGVVGPQGAGDGRAPLLADGVLPEAGERQRLGGEHQGRASAAPPAPLPPALGL